MKFQMAIKTRAIPLGQHIVLGLYRPVAAAANVKGDLPLKMAMKNEAMAEMTELIAPAMAEMMFPMIDVVRFGCRL